MAKGAYIGVSSVTKKIKKFYIGSGGTAHAVKKAYIGVNGVARLWWSGGGANKFVLGGYNALIYGPDGTNFTKVTTDIGGVYGIGYGKEKYYAVSMYKYITSIDGATWTTSSTRLPIAAYKVHGANNRIIIGSQHGMFAYSLDGESWTTATYPTPPDNDLHDIRYYKGTFYAAIESLLIASSDNGANWSNRNTTGSINYCIAVSPNRILVAGPSAIAYSPDGTTWTQVFNTTANWEGAAYGGGKFVIVGSKNGYGYISYSSDGSQWASKQVGAFANTLARIAYGNGLFVAAGNNQAMAYSSDGINWTAYKGTWGINNYDIVFGSED